MKVFNYTVLSDYFICLCLMYNHKTVYMDLFVREPSLASEKNPFHIYELIYV